MTAQTITANPTDSTISQRISTLRWLLPIPISVLPIVQQVVDQIRAVIDLIKANHLFEAESRLIALLPPTEMGKELYESNCAPCHESDGSGGLGKKLLNNKFIQSKSDKELVAFILTGRKGTAMNGFQNIIGEDELINVVALMRT